MCPYIAIVFQQPKPGAKACHARDLFVHHSHSLAAETGRDAPRLARAKRTARNDYLFYEGQIGEVPKKLKLARGGRKNAAAVKEQPDRIEFAYGLRGKLRVVLLWPERIGFKADEPFHLYCRDWLFIPGSRPGFAKRPHWRMLGSYRQCQVIDDREECGLRMCEGWG